MEEVTKLPGEITRQHVDEICAKHGTSLHLIKRKVRVHIEARREVATYLKMEKNWSLQRVGRYLNRDHSTIHYLVYGRPREMRRGLVPENEAPLPSL